jgi:hypothetical protein
MNDKDRPIDERIAAAAREHYHAPPETPRDEMWARVEGRLGADVRPLHVAEERKARRWPIPGGIGWWVGIAAALLIGLGLGRLSLGGGDSAPGVAQQETPAGATVAAAPDETAQGAADDSLVPSRAGGEERVAAAQGGRAVPAEDVVTPTPDAGDVAAPSRPPAAAPGSGLPYRVATQKHLDRSESFLAVARSGLEQAEGDPEFGTWARSLLSRTQLLLASPAAEEPRTRRLLQDLELMLAQIVVSIETGDPAEVRIADDGLQESDLLLRLRSASEGNATGPGTRRPVRSSSL